MPEITLKAEAGRPTGSRAARRLRHAGKVPAVLYGHGSDPVALAVDARDLRHALTGEAGLNALLSIQLDGTSHLAMARQLQRDPVKGTLDHVDFVIVRRDEVVAAEVPIHLVGEATEVLHEDGVVAQELFALVIHALPGDIPSGIEVDVSGLTIGTAIRVGDLALPRGVTTDVDPESPVVMGQGAQVVALPEEAAEEAAEGEEGVEAAAGGGAAAEAGAGEGGGGGEQAEA